MSSEALELNALIQKYSLLRGHLVAALAKANAEKAANGIISWPTIHEMNGANIAFTAVAEQYDTLREIGF